MGLAGVARLHWPLPDPAVASGGIERFREVRDELARRIDDLLDGERLTVNG